MTASSIDHLIVKHLDAQRANIDELNVTYINTRRGDIAYHVELNGSHLYKKLEEGQVVAFLAAPGGHTVIEPLTTKNASQAVLAGVITRSAWVQCESPKEDKKGIFFKKKTRKKSIRFFILICSNTKSTSLRLFSTAIHIHFICLKCSQ